MVFQKNGRLIDKEVVSIEDRAFVYGDGCFTTARWEQGNIQLWQRHLDRFIQAIDALALQCTIERIQEEAALFFAHLKDKAFGTVKIVISRGVSARGYSMAVHPVDIYFYYYSSPVMQQPTIINEIGILSDALGTTMLRLRGVKTLNRLEQVILKATAEDLGFSEALCVDQQNNLVEAVSSNCFIYINKMWVTPDLALSGINGTMRQEILHRMKHYQIEHQVRIIAQAEISQIEAAFLCNALQPMQMVQAIAQQQLHLEPCQQLFQKLSLHQLV